MWVCVCGVDPVSNADGAGLGRGRWIDILQVLVIGSGAASAMEAGRYTALAGRMRCSRGWSSGRAAGGCRQPAISVVCCRVGVVGRHTYGMAWLVVVEGAPLPFLRRR